MTECTNATMRDLLPALAHDALAADEAARVQAHVAGCASCVAELSIIMAAGKIFAQATPAVDRDAILAKLGSTGSPTPVLSIDRRPRRRFAMPRYAIAAAASLLIVATLALPGVLSNGENGKVVIVDSMPLSTTVPVAMLGASSLGDLGSDELEALLAELETMEATVSAEPPSYRQPITSTPEGI
jgi:hypothetical protein